MSSPSPHSRISRDILSGLIGLTAATLLLTHLHFVLLYRDTHHHGGIWYLLSTFATGVLLQTISPRPVLTCVVLCLTHLLIFSLWFYHQEFFLIALLIELFRTCLPVAGGLALTALLQYSLSACCKRLRQTTK